MNMTIDFVNCPAIKRTLDETLPKSVKVLRVWEGTMRTDDTYKVYVLIKAVADKNQRLFTETTLSMMQLAIGELVDVEIMGEDTLEFGFALPLTSHYYLHK
jgi:hypothetical protein